MMDAVKNAKGQGEFVNAEHRKVLVAVDGTAVSGFHFEDGDADMAIGFCDELSDSVVKEAIAFVELSGSGRGRLRAGMQAHEEQGGGEYDFIGNHRLRGRL